MNNLTFSLFLLVAPPGKKWLANASFHVDFISFIPFISSISLEIYFQAIIFKFQTIIFKPRSKPMYFAGLMLVLEFIFSEKKNEEDGWTR